MMRDREPCPLCGSKLGILPYDHEGNVDWRPVVSGTIRALVEAVSRSAYDEALDLIEHLFDRPVETLKQELLARRAQPVDWAAEMAPATPVELNENEDPAVPDEEEGDPEVPDEN